MNGVFLDRQSLDLDDLDFSALDRCVDNWQYYAETGSHEVADRIRDAHVVISNKVVLDKPVLAQAKNLKLICVAATGTNNVDLTAAAAHGIQVCNVTAYGTPSVVQHVFALLLSLVRNIPAYTKAVEQGRWQQSKQFCLLDYPIAELTGKVIGIVGYGELGKAVARTAQAFGMQVIIAQRPGTEAQPSADRLPLAGVLARADVLSLHCPLTADTTNLIGAEQLAQMKPTAILINTARGGIVDEHALAQALFNGEIGGAGIDVLLTEPPVAGNPLLDNPVPNLIVTPHMAWASRESRQRLLDQIVANIHSYQAGDLRNRLA